ncbi:efflux transporter outer membrane subunit [Pacificimonas flava]|uniref:Heavy metal RND efflux outer membrane protein, CzcC family n=1 Tax=Pacificimonas flava TaxID=1234595 RepID=M2S8Y7_9SPHN|nr:efflux transporter outer membrane subunit [Pacificimonas flava]EMD81825.1 Heavy metal RND efflux outer membrane protein, CzcC family [Pacificimonas flava]MBB5281645.1 multidrug efflux system outer membrane protein [Pacificimonas flava]
MRRASLSTIAMLLLAGCSMAPPLEIPAMPVAESYKYGVEWSEAVPADHRLRGEWWRAFGDPVLDDLIARADRGNPGLAAAVARLDRARAEASLSGADLYPTLDASAAVSRQRLSAGRPIGPGVPVTADQYVLGGALGYEIDLWGRVRDQVAASEAEAEAEAANLASVQLSLRAALADSYFQLCGLNRETALLRDTVEAYGAADDLIRIRHEGGAASGVDRSRSQTQLANARARLRGVSSRRAALENRIATLVGIMPADFAIAPAETSGALPAFAPGLPSTLLERRPDIARAQRRLIAANARIGVARAAMFPSIDLALTGGFQAIGTPLLSVPTGYWALGPFSAVLSLFDGGRREAREDVSEADYRALAAGYRETVLGAFREVEDSLANGAALADEEVERERAAQAAARGEELALDRYRDGAADYLEVVTAQTAALEAQQALIAVQMDRRRAAVTLIRALGGGTQDGTAAGGG